MKRLFSCKKGIGVAEVAVMAAAVIFIIFPVFSVVIEKSILLNTAEIIKDSIDVTNLGTYNALKAEALSRCTVIFDSALALSEYKELLAANLKLDENLNPKPGSIAQGQVSIDSLAVYEQNLPCVCPNGVTISRPAIHSVVSIPVKPSLYRKAMLEISGREWVDLKVHVDTDIPINN